jgi:RNA polymerase sigma-70 factor (ECF subfamily)
LSLHVPVLLEKELLEQIAEGSEAAFSMLFKQVVPVLQPSVYKIMQSEEGMQEVIQETFIRVWISRDQLPGLEKPLHWLFRVAANESYTWLRKQAIRKKHTEGYAATYIAAEAVLANGAEIVTLKETSRLVKQAVDRLPAQRRLIYQMSRNEGLKSAEIAEKLNLSHSYVRNTLVVALQSIRDYLAAAGKVMPIVYLFFKKF